MTKYKEEYIHSDHLLYVQLGENVRKLRKQRKLSQHELAEQKQWSGDLENDKN